MARVDNGELMSVGRSRRSAAFDISRREAMALDSTLVAAARSGL